MSSQLADDLRAARELIDTPEKWCKGKYGDAKSMCALGACRAAFYGVPDHGQGRELRRGEYAADFNPLAEALYKANNRGGVDLFNDDPDTTHADIMALFDRAIAQSEVE